MTSFRLGATLRVVLALSACGSAALPGTVTLGLTSNVSSFSTASASAFMQRVLQLTNAARVQARSCGATRFAAAPPLVYSAKLSQAAQRHGADMAARNYFSHDSQDGRTMAQRISATGYAWRTVGENIAAGQPTPESVVAGWLASEGHCRNIMNPGFRELGLGFAQGGTYGTYWVQDFGAQ